MSRIGHGRRKKPGLPPGTLIYTGDKTDEKPKVTIIKYDEENYREQELAAFTQCSVTKDDPSVTWINVNGISHIPNLEKLGDCFNLHPLVLEDILNIDSRPKVEDYENYLFIILKSIKYDDLKNEIITKQISLILGQNYVISLHESNGDIFKPIQERLTTAQGRLRKGRADYLAYALIDLVVDDYFLVLEKFGEHIDFLEEAVVRKAVPQTLSQVHRFKNDMIILRKSMWPLREVIGRLERREFPLISEVTDIYFQDVYDHIVMVIDTVETYRDILSGMLDIYLSSVSNRLNEVMKVLTIIATIFMPLTFITGLYGMNFKYMPELEWRYGYFAVLGLIGTVILTMLTIFKKRQWI
jgi:magnesium transporter